MGYLAKISPQYRNGAKRQVRLPAAESTPVRRKDGFSSKFYLSHSTPCADAVAISRKLFLTRQRRKFPECRFDSFSVKNFPLHSLSTRHCQTLRSTRQRHWPEAPHPEMNAKNCPTHSMTVRTAGSRSDGLTRSINRQKISQSNPGHAVILKKSELIAKISLPVRNGATAKPRC